MLLEDQLEEAKQAFTNAHEAGNEEAAKALAQRVMELQVQVAELQKAEQNASASQSNMRNPAVAAAVGALAGASVNPALNAVRNLTVPEVPAKSPSPDGVYVTGDQKRTHYNPTGRTVEESIANWTNYTDAQTEAARGTRRDTALLKKYPNMQLGPLGSASTPTPEPVPPPPPTLGQKGKSLIQGMTTDVQPTRPMDIIKGGTRGAITGGALADVPQQIAQGNYGTAGADVGIAGGNILHGLGGSPKKKAIGALIGLGSGVTRAFQGVNELMPTEQKAEGGLVQDTPYVGYPQINRNRQTGYGTGYLDTLAQAIDPTGIAGAMPEAHAAPSILAETPSQQSYREGKEAAQPIADTLSTLQLAHLGKILMKPVIKHTVPKAMKLAQQLRNLNVPAGFAPGGTVAKKIAKPLWEKFGYDKYKIAQDYPEVIAPMLATDAKTGKEFLQKQLSPEALEVQKARKAAQKEIDTGNYQPHFDINQRYYADPKHYPTAGYTQTDIVPKKAETVAKYEALANDPESLARLRGAFEKAKDRPAAKDWYAMGQLEDAFIKELGPEEGRRQFKARFADAMAATTGGADPNSNLMMAAYTNYRKELGREIPTKAADLPFPIGGRFVSGNMEQAKKLAELGEIPVTNPKRHNFSANFLGHRDVSTLDEQMSQLWDPKMMSPPPNAYGIYQAALAKEAEKAGVNPVNFQDIAWAGAKDYPGKPMMQEINEMLARTHKITGEPQEEILKGFIRGNKPMYGVGALGIGASQDDVEGHAAGGSVMPDVSMDVRGIPSMTGMPGVGYMQTPAGAMARLQMEKEMELARLRAGVSGMAMSLPGQHGVRTMPGQMDIGANIPVGSGNLDISANRSINPMPGRGHMQGVNARYTLPFKKGGLA